MKSSENFSKKETQIKEILIEQMIRANDCCKIPRIIQTLFFFFGLLQFTTFIYTPNLIFNHLNNHAIWIIMPITRFDIAIYYFTQSKYLYLLSLSILLVFDVIPLGLHLLIKKFKIIHTKNQIYAIYSTIQSMYAQLMYLYLYIPLNCILIRSLNIFLKQTILGTMDIIQLAIIGFCIAILLFSLCFKMILYSESIEMQIDVIQQLNQSILDFLKLLLHIIQLVVFALIENFTTAISFQFVLVLLIALTQLIQLINLQLCNIVSIQITLFINSFSIITVFIVMLYVQDGYSYQNIETFQLIYTPLLYCIVLRYYQIFDNFIIQRIDRETKLRYLDYFFAKLFNNQFFEQQQLTILYIKSTTKIGQLEKIQQSDIEVEEWTLQNIINKKMLDQFNQNMVKKYRKSITHQNKKINKINNILHYLAILYNFGYINIAFHQSTNLMNSNSLFRYNSFKAKSVYSDNQVKQINPKPQMQNQRSNNMNQSSQNSKSSKTQELDELRQVQNKSNRKQIITPSQYISTIEYLKVQQLNEKIQLKMKSSLQQKTNTQNSQSLRLGVANFLESESQNESLKQSVLSFLNRKLQFYLQLQNQKTINAQRLFSQAKILCFKMNKLEFRIRKHFEKFPSRKIQSVACYLQGEIMNNIFEAYKFKNSSAISDDKLLNMNKNVGQQLNSKDLVYLCLTMNETNSSLSIVKSSDRAYKFFQCEQECLKYNQDIDFLLPDFIRNEHQLLVSRFLANGQAKFYLNSEISFFRISNQTVKPISFFFDICLNVQNELQFFGFFADYNTHNSFILVDVDGQIGGISQNLLQQIGLNANDQCIDFLFNNLQIGNVIPQFFNLRAQYNKSLQFYTELQFLKIESIDVTILTNNLKIMKAKNGVLSWQDKSNLMIFDVVINIEQNELYGSYYSVIQIKEIKMNQSKMVEINSAIEHCFQRSQLSEMEGSVHKPLEFQTKKWQNIIESEQSFFQQINPLQQFEGQILGDQKQISVENFENIMSPNQSLYPDTSKVVVKKQLFFRSDEQDYSVSQLQNSQKYSNQLNDLGDVDKNILRDVMQQLGERKKKKENNNNNNDNNNNNNNNNNNEEESSSSSFAGIKRSPYYKKYEIMNLMLLPSFPNSLKTFITILILQILLSSIFCIISLVEVNTDLNRFVEEIDMIQLHAGIMVPHDLCVMLRVTLVTYQAYLAEKAITQIEYNQLVDPLYTNQYVGYYELQDNFIFQFDNRYLQDFFNNRNFTMYLMGKNGAETYSKEVNIREALNTMYSYYYSFLVLFERRMPPANMTFQVFQFANFYNFHQWLEDLTLDILVYSKGRSNQVQQKWVITWISFLIPTFSLILVALYYYLKFSAKYDRYMNLFKYCTNLNLQRDIDRYKVMVKLLNNNSESIFNYKFDLSMKEEFLNSEKPKFNLDWKNTKDYKNSVQQSNSISKLGRIMLIFGFWIIFLIISTVSTQQTTNYVTKYSETTDLYKLIQDMSYSVGPIYLLRNIRLLWGNFTYLTSSDFERSYKSIYFGLDNINKFYTLFSSFDTTKYQLSSEFINYFFDVAKKPVCSMFEDKELGFLVDYCEKGLQGNLDKGLIPTLNYIKHQIQNQMAANNFTKRIEYQLYENEGGLIVTRAFQKMTTKLKSGMLLVTNQSKSISNDVSIVYLIYAVLLSFLVLVYLGNYLFQEYYLMRKIIQLVPSAALYFDDQMERNIRILVVNQDD